MKTFEIKNPDFQDLKNLVIYSYKEEVQIQALNGLQEILESPNLSDLGRRNILNSLMLIGTNSYFNKRCGFEVAEAYLKIFESDSLSELDETTRKALHMVARETESSEFAFKLISFIYKKIEKKYSHPEKEYLISLALEAKSSVSAQESVRVLSKVYDTKGKNSLLELEDFWKIHNESKHPRASLLAFEFCLQKNFFQEEKNLSYPLYCKLFQKKD
ncbi:hypothetical protein SDC9_07763 [bioreactor metagenome]|uniref:Uncharacterized protein n=1 Tax=bioreactor metagenome TaxID=1076179 RepID=A0A644T5P1_9ZZZZ|nr:hypothetical protein [Candidatus Elulimicrobiales bacterium]